MRLRSKLLLLLVPQLIAVGVGAALWAELHNTLKRNGAWVATKTLLHKRVIGASAFYTSRQTLSGQELDLGRWLGFQEVIHREPLALRELSVRFRLEEGAYLDVLYVRDEEGSLGCRIATEEERSLAFRADPTGRFLERRSLSVGNLAPGEWQELRLRIADDGVEAALNGEHTFPLEGVRGAGQRFGFRGAHRSAVVDDVLVTTRQGEVMRESFANTADFLLALGTGLVGLAVLNALAYLLLRRVRWSARRIRLVVTLGLTMVAGSVAAFAFYRLVLAKSYRPADPAAEQKWREEHAGHVDASVQQYFAGPPEAGVVRVLVIGTSQTWGAGATAPGDTFVEALERLLQREPPPAGRFECVNAGVSGLHSAWLLSLYRDRWLSLEPDVVVLNLANNDTDAGVFAEALEGFLATNEEHGIATVFALEANAVEARPHGLPLHATMRRLAEQHGVPVVDVHGFLAERAYTGFLWWDLVHPTTYGHALIAEALEPAIRAAASDAAR